MSRLIRSLSHFLGWGLGALALCTAVAPAWAAGAGVLEIRNGYFWDPGSAQYFVPRGIAYQSWNPPVGANQSFEQIDYDLLEFKKMHANSVRCEFVWSQVQTGPDEWDWSKPDHLVAEAEKLGLKLFVIIGFQYPPAWFPAEWRGINDQGLTPEVLTCLGQNPANVTNCLSRPLYDQLFTNNLPADVIAATLSSLTSSVPADIIGALKQKVTPEYLPKVLGAFISDVVNYEHPDARRVYTNHLAKVVDRYKNSQAIGAWIMGNECAYFDLWEDFKVYKIHRFLGYDPYSQAAFRSYITKLYNGNIAALNANWRTTYPDFQSVQMPGLLPADRNLPSLTDVIHWRQQSIGSFIAAGARTARMFDPNHLLTYSMVGGIFNGNDANNTCEDAPAIVAACQQAGGPLDFWSINNYAWASSGSELRSGDFGISKYRALLGLPVMISETGHSSTEDLFAGAGPRQAKALPGQIWESLMSGAVGTHLFHWNDRNQFTRGYFDREKGFGIVNEDRTVKNPVYWNVLEMFRRMSEIRIENLLGASTDPAPDVQFFWSGAGDLGWPRANQENAMLWGVFKRLGFQPGIIGDVQFQRGAYTNAAALVLSRAWQLDPETLKSLASDVVGAGVHLHANADLPGQFDAYLRPNPEWTTSMASLFGLDVSKAVPAFDSGAVSDATAVLGIFGAANFGPFTRAYSEQLKTWKIWHGVRAIAGTTVLTQTGLNNSQQNPRVPALHLHQAGRAKTAASTFAVGDAYQAGGDPARLYSVRYDILHAIYRDHFGLKPVVDISGPGAKQVISDYRFCQNGSVLLSILNEETTPAVITLSALPLLAHKTIENLTLGGVMDRNSSGQLGLTLSPDEYLLLYAYAPNADKLWIKAAPLVVRPGGSAASVDVGYDLVSAGDYSLTLHLEQVHPAQRSFAASAAVVVHGRGTNTLALTIPDPDLGDPGYLPSSVGGEYAFRATLEREGALVSETTLPVRLVQGLMPSDQLPEPAPGGSYSVRLQWDELPSYQPDDPTPLDRARLWESEAANAQHYNLLLEVRDRTGQPVASDLFVTSRGTGEHLFNLSVPAGAQGPFSWSAMAQSAPQTSSLNVDDGFEGRARGEDLSPFKPWYGEVYSQLNNAQLLSQGVLKEPNASPENRLAYLVVSNPPDPGAYSGFYLVRGGEPWALPSNRQLWDQYLFSFEFKERQQLPCVLELQLKDSAGNWLSFAKPYAPGPDGWDTVGASLAQFTSGSSPSVFNPGQAHEWVLNIQMLQKNTTYQGYFDNVHFTGPPSVSDDFENRQEGELFSRIAPWSGYGYDAPGHQDIKLNQGVGLDEQSEGSQAAFLVAWYKTNSAAFAGFGLTYPFPKTWALPVRQSQWTNYTVSFDFKERFAKDCMLELQIASPDTFAASGAPIKHALNFLTRYTPGSNDWHTVSASLDRFTQPDYFATFDPTQVATLILNVQMQESNPTTNVVYVGWFDNIQFHAPVTAGPGDATYALYTSQNDSFRIGTVTRAAQTLTLTWIGQATVETADDPQGPWTSAGLTTSPASIPINSAQRFYRLRR